MFLLGGLLLCCWIPTVSLQNLMFTIEPKSVVVRKGSPAILNCQTNNQTSDILIQWKKGYNTRWIFDYANKPYKLLSNGSLSFPSVETGDENVYFCSAIHRGTANTIYSKIPARITLAYINSTFITPPALSTPIREHVTVTLTCISGASQPLPSVTWEKDGRPITDQNIVVQYQLPTQKATSATLQLTNVSVLADRGYYRCVATNPLLPDEPRKSQEVYLMVLPKDDEPRIEVHPVNTISPRRHPLRLDCVIVGVPPPVVFWSHDNVRVSNTSDRMVYPNGSLVIHSLARQDSGQYSCNGTNSKGSVASSNIFLNVAFIDFNFKRNPENKTVVNGSRVEMICEPPSHFPKSLRYKWYKSYRKIIMDGRIGISSSGSLVISPVLKSDEGVYICDVSLSKEFLIKTRTSTAGYLTVNVPPYFLTKPSHQIVVLGQTLRLTCKAAGFPKPLLEWYHGKLSLSNTSRLTLGADGSLVLSMVNINDAGQYKCSVENVAGNNVAMAAVIVHAPPNGTVMPSDTKRVLGNNATFLCRFAGNPPPVIVWYFKRANERAVLLARNSSRYIQSHEELDVVNVSEADNGVFTCVGENVVGMQNFSARLMVLGKSSQN
ncbi:Down syndrome cell adhesion molecule-like [Paramuricea clavata]|uniref:Down syndrome cell adhesion molecule-like n=1 Tax=Paramuricea clavata TaxID=317549 RepID=A0A6S7JWL7_PARCT|nr:Down syndrome cell adhesion molecule-like [Paramuricea clavata]